jgi:hypothetical protein
MKTKQFAWQASVIALFIIFCCSDKGTAQTVQSVTLYTNTSAPSVNLPVQANQIVSLTGYDWISQPTLSGNMADGTLINLTPFNHFPNGGPIVSSQLPQTFTGLTNITLDPSGLGGGNTSWATFQITTPTSANVISNYVPADAIVIPASATGNVQIILESSTDLVNWTAANPGTYGASSATNRFFRVRAVHN